MDNGLLRNGSGYIDPTASIALRNVQKGEKKMNDRSIKRGDMFYIKKTGEPTGSEQEAGRPGIVVSNDNGNLHAPIVSVVYLTTQEKNQLPTHAQVYCNKQSIALCEQVHTVSKERVGDYITSCSPKEMKAVDEALAVALGLENYSADAATEIETLKAKCTDLFERMQEIESEKDRLKEQLLYAGDKEQITVYEPEDDSFYKRFYNDLFHSDKKIEIKVG